MIATEWTRHTEGARLCFITQTIDYLGRGANECKASLLDFTGELCVLGQETISGWNDIGNGAKVIIERTLDGSCRRHVRGQS